MTLRHFGMGKVAHCQINHLYYFMLKGWLTLLTLD